MRLEMLANRVQVTVRLIETTDRERETERITMSVAWDGHVDLPYTRGGDDHRRALDILVDELGVVRWCKIGPEDTEPFLTPKWMAYTRRIREVLDQQEWLVLSAPEGLSQLAGPQVPGPTMTQPQAETCERLNPWGRNGYFEQLPNGTIRLTIHGKGVYHVAEDGTIDPGGFCDDGLRSVFGDPQETNDANAS